MDTQDKINSVVFLKNLCFIAFFLRAGLINYSFQLCVFMRFICVCRSMFLYVFFVCFLLFCFILFLFVYCVYFLVWFLKRKVKNGLIWKTEEVGRVWE